MSEHLDDHIWQLTPHICRICFGRVLHAIVDYKHFYRCSNCGAEREGKSEAVICMCGMKLGTKTDAGIRCVSNKDRRPELPNEIVAEQAQPT